MKRNYWRMFSDSKLFGMSGQKVRWTGERMKWRRRVFRIFGNKGGGGVIQQTFWDIGVQIIGT